MATGGVFKLVANDGKADRMLLATALLRQRILDIFNARKHAGKADLTPTLVDIERTHILYVNAHFKPFAAIGYEYSKIKPQSGTPLFGSSVVFSIPQYGDFFYDIVVRTALGAAYAQSAAIANATTTTVKYMDIYGNVIEAATNGYLRNAVRYCEYPGYRLFNKVSFEVNGNPLDSYDTDTIVMLGKFSTPINKVAGHDKLNGQQVPLTGYGLPTTNVSYDTNVSINNATSFYLPTATLGYDQTQSANQCDLFATNTGQVAIPAAPPLNDSDQGVVFTNSDDLGNPLLTTATSGQTGFSTTVGGPGVSGTGYPTRLDPSGSTPANSLQYDIGQLKVDIVNGLQVPKPYHQPTELWSKLRFWFNDDVRLAVPSVSIPFGQRFINMEICNASDMVFEVPSLFQYTLPYVVGTPTIDPVMPLLAPYYVLNGLSTSYDITNMEMYINNIFVNPEIHDIYIRRIGFSLIRVYRKQGSNINTDTGNVLLSALKWPIEYLWVGFKPKFNTTTPKVASTSTYTGNLDMWHDWWRYTQQNPTYTTPQGGVALQTGQGGGVYGTSHYLSSVAATLWSPCPNFQASNSASTVTAGPSNGGTYKYWVPVQTVDTLGLVSHGIPIYAEGTRDTFFSEYLPYNYGGLNLNTPTDFGVFFINFALFPRSYQPSGHLNISRARETYLYWTGKYIGSNSSVNLTVIAVAINFLLITDGSAILRYST